MPAVSQSGLSPGKAVSGICAGLDMRVAVDTDDRLRLGNKCRSSAADGGRPRRRRRDQDPLTGTSFSVKSAGRRPVVPGLPVQLLSVIEPQGLPVFKCKTGGGAIRVESTSTPRPTSVGLLEGHLDAQGKTDGGYCGTRLVVSVCPFGRS